MVHFCCAHSMALMFDIYSTCVIIICYLFMIFLNISTYLHLSNEVNFFSFFFFLSVFFFIVSFVSLFFQVSRSQYLKLLHFELDSLLSTRLVRSNQHVRSFAICKWDNCGDIASDLNLLSYAFNLN